MKLERSKDWWLARARNEGDSPIAAGGDLFLPAAEAEGNTTVERAPVSSVAASVAEDTRIAFGRFVNLMRRRLGLSVEKLADTADVDVSELVMIEDDVHHRPEPRTVYCLAQLFQVPQQRLMQLAGLTVSSDARFVSEAVRFAARSEPFQKLSSEERAALDAFVSVLSERTPMSR